MTGPKDWKEKHSRAVFRGANSESWYNQRASLETCYRSKDISLLWHLQGLVFSAASFSLVLGEAVDYCRGRLEVI